MYFYEFIFITLLIYAFEAKLSSIDAGVDKVSTDFQGFVIFITFNNTSLIDYDVKAIPGNCCLTGESGQGVPAGQIKIIKLKAAIRDCPREDKCLIYVHLKPYKNTKEIVKIFVHIFIEGNNKTEIITLYCNNNYKNATFSFQFPEINDIQIEDGMYKKSRIKHCSNTPSYLDINNMKNSKVGYPLSTHVMVKRDLHSDDFERVKTLRETVSVNTTKPWSENWNDLNNTENVCPKTAKNHVKIMKHEKVVYPKKITLDHSVYKYLKQYRWITALLAAITIIQCILIFTICMRRRCQCFGEKRVISHFFRTYQQDSVSTPLIGTSFVDIENSKNNILSESSTNIANLKCYKACGRDKSETTKVSMSDDILSKFINRREWKNNYKNSPEYESKDDVEQVVRVHSKHKNVDEKITKDMLENKCTVTGEELPCSTNKEGDLNLSDSQAKYHSFSCYNTQIDSESTVEKKDTVNNIPKLSEKAAQTYFSKDSLDAILSERDIYLADENLSKYTLSNDSGKNKSTELLNKASRNVVKYFNTLLHKRSRQSSQSEPGKDKDLKLLHMSEASLYSSNDSE